MKKNTIYMLTFKKTLWYNLYVSVILLEKYPSLVEGTGLENREVGDGAGVRIPLSPPVNINIAE